MTTTMRPCDRDGAVLTVDLDALAGNWRLLNDRAGGAECGAAVKADAYGAGVAEVAPVLAREGCARFFVATLDEGIALRALVPEAFIAVLIGPLPGTEPEYAAHRLTPALNHLGEVERWRAFAGGGGPREAVLHLDTGMNRLGMPAYEVETLAAEPDRLEGIELCLVMSHLACAEECDNPMSAAQLAAFRTLADRLPGAPRSLAASSGIFRGPEFHFDLVRPGAALYGINPTPDAPNPMAEVVRLQGKIVQLRDVDTPETVGYGATHKITAPGRIATVPVGYADGYLRSFSNHGFAAIGNVKVPVVGRVSMDLITLDVSALAPEDARPGTVVDLIGGACALDDVAARAGTIAYEILTSLGRRYARRYVGGSA